MSNFKFKDVEIITDGFWYDLFDGGYIVPSDILEDPKDIQDINNAIALLLAFRDELEDAGILEYT